MEELAQRFFACHSTSCRGRSIALADLRRRAERPRVGFRDSSRRADGWSLWDLVLEDLFAAYIEGVNGIVRGFAARSANLHGVGRN
jgi:hypothetical protein